MFDHIHQKVATTIREYYFAVQSTVTDVKLFTSLK